MARHAALAICIGPTTKPLSELSEKTVNQGGSKVCVLINCMQIAADPSVLSRELIQWCHIELDSKVDLARNMVERNSQPESLQQFEARLVCLHRVASLTHPPPGSYKYRSLAGK